MENLLISVILLVILALAIRYICKAKKNGKRCIGCPAGGNCMAKPGKCACEKSEE